MRRTIRAETYLTAEEAALLKSLARGSGQTVASYLRSQFLDSSENTERKGVSEDMIYRITLLCGQVQGVISRTNVPESVSSELQAIIAEFIAVIDGLS